MSIILADSFDYYNGTGDLVLPGGNWSQVSGTLTTTTPFNVGQGYQWGNQSAQTNIFTSNDSTFYIAFNLKAASGSDYQAGSNTNGTFITFSENQIPHVTLHFAMNNQLYLRLGSNTSTTVIANTPHNLSNSLWSHWQFKITVNATAGVFEFRKDGNPINDFSANSLNTKNTTANAWMSRIQLSGLSGTVIADDMFINGSSGTQMNTWPGQIRSIQLMPVGDTAQKDFQPSTGQITVVGPNSNASTLNLSGNVVYFGPNATSIFIGGAVSKTTVKLSAGYTGHMRCAIYTCDTSGIPGSLVQQSAEVTNPVTGDNDFTFSPAVSLSDTGTYVIGIWSDTNFVPYQGTAGNYRTFAQTYSNTFPSSPTGTGVTGGSISVRATYSNVYNYSMVNENQENGDTDYVVATSANSVDLYSMATLNTTPASIATVIARQLVKKTDAGSKVSSVRINSGGTMADSSNLVLTTSYQWQIAPYNVDPNTNAVWTPAAVNLLQAGPKIVF
jgi:hypothetical protein